IECDVFVCCRDSADAELAGAIAADLRRRGFRVFSGDRPSGEGADAKRLRLIQETPDFVLVVTPGALDACVEEDDPMRVQIAHALQTDRAVTVVTTEGADAAAGALPPALARLATCLQVRYSPGRTRESLAILANSLSSATEVDDRMLWRLTKWAFVGVAAVFVMVLANAAVPPVYRYLTRPVPKPPVPAFALAWSVFGQRLQGGTWTEFPLTDGARVLKGDQFRLTFIPTSDGFAYVVTQDSRGDVAVLFPSLTIRGASGVRAGKTYSVPLESDWARVDGDRGLDTIHLVASYDPLENLEELGEEPDRDSTVAVRRDLLQSTITGLLDNRHVLMPAGARIRNGNPVDRSLPILQTAPTVSAPLSSGAVVVHPLVVSKGLLSAAVEIRVRFDPTK
ncbi:MAG: DUF4384 domain-containing protein, partial [Acidobacteria bacterium]|nr:DUF4384 domain-containing protein [Acidobacteriota bacterium]